MRVLLADGHPQVRRALRIFIEEQPGLSIVGEVWEADDLLHEATVLQPDLILLEWELRGRPPNELLSALSSSKLAPQVIILSWRAELEQPALAAGADGFVDKAGGPERLLTALRRLPKNELE